MTTTYSFVALAPKVTDHWEYEDSIWCMHILVEVIAVQSCTAQIKMF